MKPQRGLCSLLNQKCLLLEDVSGSACQTQLDGVRLGSHFVWLSCILSASGVVCQIKLYFISFKSMFLAFVRVKPYTELPFGFVLIIADFLFFCWEERF